MSLEKTITGDVDMGILTYAEGQDVEVRVTTPTGELWVPGVIDSYRSGLMKVMRGNQLRTVTDLSTIRPKDNDPLRQDYISLESGPVRLFKGTKSYDIEMGLAAETARMNHTPLKVDLATYKANLVRVAAATQTSLEKCRAIAQDETFRPHATADCLRVFRDKLGHKMSKTTQAGAASVDHDVLLHLDRIGEPLARPTMDFRELRVHLSQLEKWAPYAAAGQVQSRWDSLGQPHGRYSSSDPCMHNRVVEIRETITPADGHVFVSADWGMAEYLTWASLSKDSYLSDIFTSGRDLHTEMGQQILAVNPDIWLGEESPRDFGKTTNFALLYRMATSTLAKSLGVDSQTAGRVVKAYRDKAPTASLYIEQVLKQAAYDGYVDTVFGRRLYCPTLATLTGGHLSQLQKTVWHHHNAGSAAEALKLKQWQIGKELTLQGLDKHVRLALNMYDELIYEVNASPLIQDDATALIKSVMEAPAPGFLPFKVDLRTGLNWFQISK